MLTLTTYADYIHEGEQAATEGPARSCRHGIGGVAGAQCGELTGESGSGPTGYIHICDPLAQSDDKLGSIFAVG